MKYIAAHRSLRWSHDGWALMIRGTGVILDWSWCTTRRECRELLKEQRDLGWFDGLVIDVVKVKQTLEVA